jgi:hypothetical protein
MEDEKVGFYVRVGENRNIITYLNPSINTVLEEDVKISFEDYDYALSVNANYLDINNKPIRVDNIKETKPYVAPISMRQCRLMLLGMGLLELVETEMAKDKTLSIEWEYATEIKIDNPLVVMLSEKLGLDEEARVEMFKEARLL